MMVSVKALKHSVKYRRTGDAEDEDRVEDDGPHAQDQSRRRGVLHWLYPMLMLGSFVAGIVFAVAHHVYYTSLDDTIVGSAARQQWPLRFGTAFAFLVQTCLSSATGTAYVQCVWRRCRQAAVTISAMDAAFAVEKNVFMFFNPKFLVEFPLATAIAIILWCIPLSSLVTPATLGVTSRPNTRVRSVSVNQPSINNKDTQTSWIYETNPPTELNRMLATIASTGEILKLDPPEGLQNVSYTIQMFVPVIRCRPSDEHVQAQTAEKAFQAALNGTDYSTRSPGYTPHTNNLTYTIPSSSTSDYDVLGQIGYYSVALERELLSSPPRDLWIAVANLPPDVYLDAPPPYNVSYYTCSVRNASVSTDIAIADNSPSIKAGDVQLMEWANDDPGGPGHIGAQNSTSFSLDNYATLAYGLYHLLTGFVGRQMLGRDGQWDFQDLNWNTSMDQTVLRTAADFSAVVDGFQFKAGGPDAVVQERNLTTLIEELSINASWSLMSMPGFNNEVPTQVNQTSWVNKYTYDPTDLYISYGCSITACLITVAVGCFAFHSSRESYDTFVSSLGRSMQSSDMAALFGAPPDKGNDIAKTNVRLVREGAVERFRINRESVALQPI